MELLCLLGGEYVCVGGVDAYRSCYFLLGWSSLENGRKEGSGF